MLTATAPMAVGASTTEARSWRRPLSAAILPLYSAVLLLCFGCGDGDDPPEKPPVQDPDELILVNHLQMKGTHNSYHIAPDPLPPCCPELAYTMAPLDVQLDEQGVRSFELDIHYVANDGWRVFHTLNEPGYPNDLTSTCEMLSDCLSTIEQWSQAHRRHHPLFIMFEAKDQYDTEKFADHVAELEQTIRSAVTEDNIVTPPFIRKEYPSLMESVAANGWPSLKQTRGKMFFLVHKGDVSSSQLLFNVDIFPGVSDTLFVSLGAKTALWDLVKLSDLVQQGYMIRVRVDENLVEAKTNDRSKLEHALSLGAHFITTDFPVPVAGSAYSVDIPAGTPSRCNPVSALESCTPAAIENLGQ